MQIKVNTSDVISASSELLTSGQQVTSIASAMACLAADSGDPTIDAALENLLRRWSYAIAALGSAQVGNGKSAIAAASNYTTTDAANAHAFLEAK